jgi:hypothetical protein
MNLFGSNFSNTHQDMRYTLDRESYYQVFPKNIHIIGDNVSEESSKYSGVNSWNWWYEIGWNVSRLGKHAIINYY